jgi:hypothetical protein
MIWIRTQDRETLFECNVIKYVERERYTENYLKLQKGVKANPHKYMNPKTNKRLNNSKEIGDFLGEREQTYTEYNLVNYNMNDNDYYILGKYKSKERCLEVFDEIERYIKGYEEIEIDKDSSEDIMHTIFNEKPIKRVALPSIYHMPKE